MAVLFVNSHLAARSVAAGRAPRWTGAGKLVVDEMAGEAAREARLPEAIRHSVLMKERPARVVRTRILRSTLDAMAAEAEENVGLHTNDLGALAPPRPEMRSKNALLPSIRPPTSFPAPSSFTSSSFALSRVPTSRPPK